MEVAFESQLLRTLCENEVQAKLRLGAEVAEQLKHRLGDIMAAKSPADLIAGHPRLSSDGQATIIDLCNGQQLVFKANHTRCPKTKDDVIDWSRVSRIKIVKIEKNDAE